MPIPNPSPKSPVSGTPIVGMDTKTQFYKSMNASGTARVYKDDSGREYSEDEFKKMNPSGYTEGTASNSHVVQDAGSQFAAGGSHLEVDPYAKSTPAPGATTAPSLGSAERHPTAAPTPAKVSDMGMSGGGDSNPIMDGLAQALQFRRPMMG